MRRSLLAIFAHPDDESFGPGGTLARYAAEGVEVRLIVASRGERSTLGSSTDHMPEQLGALREEELRCAAAALRLKDVTILDYPDTRIGDADPAELRAVLRNAIEGMQPQVVLTFEPEGITGNPDHVAVTEATTLAFLDSYPLAARTGDNARRLYYWTIPDKIARHLRSISDIPFKGTPERCVTTVIETNSYLDTQRQAIKCHRSQTNPVPTVLRERLEAQNGREYFVRAGAETPVDTFESSLLAPGSPPLHEQRKI
jgi:LmbE family N-acetylglucosaminyl deacetylase